MTKKQKPGLKSTEGRKRRPYKRTKIENIDKEIEAAYQRYWWLKKRKRLDKENAKKKAVKVDPIKEFYDKEVKNYVFTKKYNTYKEAMLQSSKMFVAYHNRVSEALYKYGTNDETLAFDKISGGLKTADITLEDL